MRLLLIDLLEREAKLFSHYRHRGESGRHRLDGTECVTERATGLDGRCRARRRATLARRFASGRHRSMRGARSRRAPGSVLDLQAHLRRRTLACERPLDVSRPLAA